MWQLKTKLNLNSKGNDFPTAKFDGQGNLITTKQGLLRLYEDEYKQRLAQNPPHPGLENLQYLKENLFRLRFKIAASEQITKWTEQDFLKVTKRLKNNKARDSNGLIYELFKPTHCGPDVKNSLLNLFNNVKQNLSLPDFFNSMKITSIYKKRGSKALSSNEHGIFNLSKIRNLMDH